MNEGIAYFDNYDVSMDSPSLTYNILCYVTWMLWTKNAMVEVADVVKLSKNNEIYNLTTQNVTTSLIKIRR